MAAVAAGFGGLQALISSGPLARGAERRMRETAGFGQLVKDPHRIIDLPKGFTYRVISRVGDPMSDGLLTPGRADGMAAFSGPDGKTILIRNHENDIDPAQIGPFGRKLQLLQAINPALIYDRGKGTHPALGGTTTLVYDTRTETLDHAHLSLAGTMRNCAGGPTPWGTWLSCEEDVTLTGGTYERDHGYVFEVPASPAIPAKPEPVTPVPIRGMGRFNHEAVGVDPRTGIVYLTEDRPDGLFYRFIPNKRGKMLEGGRLEALAVRGKSSLDTTNWERKTVEVGRVMEVEWRELINIEPKDDDLRLRGFKQGAARFARGEGLCVATDAIYFVCTAGGSDTRGQVWKYRPSPGEGTHKEADGRGKLELFIEPNNKDVLDMCDNMTVAPWGDLILCEDGDGGADRVMGVTPRGEVYPIARNALSSSEFAGACFSPDGTTLFVNIQVNGLTLAIKAPDGSAWRS